MTVQMFCAATQYAAATVAAALRSGLFGRRADHRRILVVSDTSAVPEIGTPLDLMPGFEALRPEFDEVRSWNETIRPHHPAGWSPRPQDVPLWEKSLRLAWRLGDEPVEVACESIQANPSRAIAAIFANSPVHVYADGLMSYGPTRNRIPLPMSSRIRRLLHLDLVPGLRPMLLSEYGVEPVAVPGAEFLAVLREVSDAADEADGGGLPAGTALLLGQYLSALELISRDEEDELHLRMLRGAAALGHRTITFKPHPSAPADSTLALQATARELGVSLDVLRTPVLAETLYERARPELVVGCFSTAMMTAAALYGIPAARVGTGLLLDRITPYQNSNRVPLTVVDALLPALEGDERAGKPVDLAAAGEVDPLVRAVGFCMQATAYPELREQTAELLRTLPDAELTRYFKRRRLTSLGLPGGRPVRAAALRRHPAVRKVVRKLR
ncbi:alpha-2,8-polysialyltransferase family protein [Streptomyces sp. MUM 178J]|uniref:alpha-2,8-polysialyltransferase family protein n=1 Tax=Streptomyces sp. MUM 178J TaxID=2791991 RepID=UPI001F0410DE|nr:alpha-2,8-polysialyltransferase family protein [Streptomyces sp. MUM 178J]WRQ79779.1 alpha-2,8-polysialyltransferase family protein [Streptomyces sp. MUM 178J]